MSNQKAVKPAAAPADAETNSELELLDVAQVDLGKVLDSSSEEVADMYGEALYPLFAPSDDKGKTRPYNRAKMVAFLDRVKPKLKKAVMRDGLNGGLKVLKEEGLHFEVQVSGKAAEAFQLEERGSFDWGALLKWVGGGLAVAVIAYGAYKLYVHYQASKDAKAGGTGNAIAM